MSKRDESGRVFPSDGPHGSRGISVRDLFAAMVMKGQVALYGCGASPFYRPEPDDPANPPSEYVLAMRKSETLRLRECRKIAAMLAYEMADAMLEARQIKEPREPQGSVHEGHDAGA